MSYKRVTLEAVSEATRDEILAEDNFYLGDWGLTDIDFGKWKVDAEVVLHIYRNLGKYYFERNLAASNLHEEDVAVRIFFENQTGGNECGCIRNSDHEVNSQAYLQHDTPSFFKKLFATWPEVDDWAFDFEDFIQSFSDFGFSAHVSSAKRFIAERISKSERYQFTPFRDQNSFECLAFHHPEQVRLMLAEEDELSASTPEATATTTRSRL